MATYDLCSAVFVLRSSKALPDQQFLGLAAYKLFLAMLNRLSALTRDPQYAALAVELHDLNGPLPFTVSDLFPSGGEYYWFRVTGLEPRLYTTLQTLIDTLTGQMVEIPPRQGINEPPFDVKIETGLLGYHDWARQTTYNEFVQAAWKTRPEYILTLDFMTPTVLKSVGVYRPFPEPILIFKLLYERLLKLHLALPFQPEAAYLEAFADYFVGLTDYHIQCTAMDLSKGPATAFYGWATYAILRKNEDFHKRAQTQQDRAHEAHLLMIDERVFKNYIELLK